MTIFSTERLDLEPTTAAHAQEVWPLTDDQRMWQYFPELRPLSLEHLRTIYERRQRGAQDDQTIWENRVCRERSSGLVVGEVQATIHVPQRLSYIAYAIFPVHQQNGYAREAARALIDRVRTLYNVERFIAEMDVRNEPSYRLAESLGFSRLKTRGTEYVYDLRLRD